ncbi:MAG: hypothetical protein QM477_05830 [Planctomycetota bacterium]
MKSHPQPPVEEEGWKAIALVLVVGAVLLSLSFLSGFFGLGGISIFLFIVAAQSGWVQILYLPVMALRFRKQGRMNKAKGFAISSAILFTLTGLCNGLMVWG